MLIERRMGATNFLKIKIESLEKLKDKGKDISNGFEL